GWVTDKAAFFSGVDVYALPSLEESFGLSLLEAMAHGLPVAATDTPGPASLIRHGENGLLALRGDAASMADALQLLLSDEALLLRVRAQAALDAEAYRAERVGPLWGELVSRLVNGDAI
ncbi:MAG: glycosyltransferase family 4 protein, partial [Rickettsiales bacterium]|nr:glycosyltransferase family 4 protein [Rickettsiales bacterium]